MAALIALAAPWLGPPGAEGQEDSPQSLLVLAAASLSDVLPRVAADWEASGGTPVKFSFAATSRLAPQVVQGIRADLLISADRAWMDWVEARGGVKPASRRVVAGNRLVVAVPTGSDLSIREPADLVSPLVGRLGLADENVPAGRYAQQALETAGVWPSLRTHVVRGGSVRGTLDWVARAEVDAAVVYATDAGSEDRVRIAFQVPAALHTPIEYPAAVLAASAAPASAGAFLDFLAGPSAAAVLSEVGFTPAPVENGPTQSPPGDLTLPNPVSAVRLSVAVALLATLIGLVPAIAAGWVLARKEFVGKSLLATVVLAPLVLPPVVTGFLLLTLFGSQGALGGWLAGLGVRVPFTLLGATAAALIVGMPLYIMAIRGAFQAVDTRYEEVSWTLGVHKFATFRRVTLPLALPGIAAGAVLAFARALGEFGATIVLAGNVEGRTRTIALAVYSLLESPSGRSQTWVLVGASVAISLVALLGFEALTRRQRARVEDHRG